MTSQGTKSGHIDKTTKVNLGILGTLLVAAFACALFVSDLKASIESVEKSLREVKQALDRNTSQSVRDGKVLVGLHASDRAQDRDIAELKRRVLELERKK